MKTNKKKLLLFLFSISLFLTGFTLGIFAQVPPSGPCYLDVPFGTASYYVGQFSNGSYWMVNNTNWGCEAWDTNKTLIQEWALGNMTYGLLFLQENTFNTSLTLTNTQMVIEQYQGQYKIYSNQGQVILPQLASDPNTLGWGQNEQGRIWYNTADDEFKFWNGTAIDTFRGQQGEQGESGRLEGEQPYAYLVFNNATSTYLQNGTSGQIDDNSANLHTVMDWAINNLTSGRTWKEKIVVKGNYTLSCSITLKSCLLLDFRQARITCSSGIDAFIDSESIHNITILGGYWRGYSASSNNWVFLDSSTDVEIIDATVTNFLHAVETGTGDGSTSSRIHVCHCNIVRPIGSGSSGAGVHVYNADDVTVESCKISTVSQGVLVEGNATGTRIINNDISGWSDDSLNHAVYVGAGNESLYESHGALVSGNLIHNRGTNGGSAILVKSWGNVIANNIIRDLDCGTIIVNSELATYNAWNNKIDSNTFINCTGWACIFLGTSAGNARMRNNVDGNRVSNNIFHNCSYPIRVGGNSSEPAYADGNVVCDNDFYKSTVAISIMNDGARGTRVSGNAFNQVTTELSDSGTNTIWGWGNVIDNKPCETLGTADASDTDSITLALELAGTPQTVVITVNENDARYIAMAYSITSTEFNLYLYDDTAGALETTDKTISYIAIYKP